MDYEDIQWWTQFLYDWPFHEDFLFYFEYDLNFRFDSKGTVVSTPIKMIFNYYPSSQWTIYLPTELAPDWDGSDWAKYYAQIGIGAKYQLTSHIDLETLLTKFVLGKNGGAGQTYNLGIRFIN